MFRTASAWALSRRLVHPLSRQSRASQHAAPRSCEWELPFSRAEYADRRNAVLSEMRSNCIALFPSAMAAHMSEDVPYLYHQNTDLLYLCGCMEPGSVLMLDSTSTTKGSAGSGQGQSALFLRPRDLERESWDGPMLGVSESTRTLFGVDAVFPDNELPKIVAERLAESNCHEIYFDPAINDTVSSSLMQTLSNSGDGQLLSKWARAIVPKSFVSSSRLVKSPSEQAHLKTAASIISMAMNDAMAFSVLSDEACNGSKVAYLAERHIEAAMEYSSKIRGAARMAFPCVVAGGKNGTTLHYMANNARALDGELVMVDAGCQYRDYCSDVSRTWPVGGKFSAAQRALYELVLDVQLRCIDMSRVEQYRGEPVSLNTIHMVAAEELSRGLIELGFLKGKTVEQFLEERTYSRWFNHAIGHYLGMDVHDTHAISKNMPLQAGMCITIEPGLYVRADDEMAPPEFRGIGIRIEDDLLVAPSGQPPTVLSHEAVKTVADIEQLVGSADSTRVPAPMWRHIHG